MDTAKTSDFTEHRFLHRDSFVPAVRVIPNRKAPSPQSPNTAAVIKGSDARVAIWDPIHAELSRREHGPEDTAGGQLKPPLFLLCVRTTDPAVMRSVRVSFRVRKRTVGHAV